MDLRGMIGACLALCAAGASWAQTPTGSIAGNVVDSSGDPVASAVVNVRSPGTNGIRTVLTDLAGGFKVSNLAPGSFEVTVTKAGFHPLHERNVAVELDRTAQLALILELGSVAESVEVAAKSALIDSGKTGIDELLGFSELVDLVQDSRTITDLGYFASGVGRRARGGLGSGFAVGGARPDNTNFIVDGFSDYDPRTGGTQAMPNYDAVEEFQIQTAGSAAEYGRMAGGVINMVLRTGTNEFHGSAFEFFRSDALAARNFFDAQKSELLRNQFGATLGGPITIPSIYNGKNRTFFLVSWEAVHASSGENRLSQVPTALEHSGDFSQTLDAAGRHVVVKDPLTGAAFPQNRIPLDRIDSIASRLAAYYPLPNGSDPLDNYHADALNRTRWDSVLLKVDEHLGERDDLALRYLTRVNSTGSPYTGSDLGLFGSHASTRPTLAGVNYNRVFSPTLVNEFRAGFLRMSDHEAGAYAGRDINAQLGLPTLTADPHLLGFPRFNITNLAILGESTAMPLDFAVNNYEVADALSWSYHRHLVKFGADLVRTQLFQQLYNNTRGNFNFLGRWSGVPFADFLLGLPDSTSRQLGSSPAYLFSTDWGLFIQDEYAISSRVSLNIGLRYEMMRPPYEKYGRMSSFVPELGKVVIADARGMPDFTQRVAAAGLTGLVTTASQAGLPNALVYPNNHNVAPRFGFALRPSGSSTLVVRGGYGIYHANSLLNPIRNDLTNVYPFTISQTFNRVVKQPGALTLENPFPATLATLAGVTNVNGFELHPRAQYLQNYTLSVEQQLGSNTTIELEYIGSRGTHLPRQYDLNQPFREPSLKLPNGSFPRPFAGFGTINFYGFGSNSVYNAGSLTLRRRYRNGFYYGVTYIYSKSIDEASQVAGASQGDYPGVQNSRDLRAERGRSDWDTGHSLLLFGAYTLPFHRNRLVRGWQISTTVRLYSGQPFTPRVANTNLNLGEANRPNRIGKGTLADPNVNDWFDIAAFPVVPQGTFRFGNSGRNILDGPGSAMVNAALLKNFRFAERRNLQLRCEAINLLNRANFGLPVDYVDAQNAGKILSADPGRVLQLGIRVRF